MTNEATGISFSGVATVRDADGNIKEEEAS